MVNLEVLQEQLLSTRATMARLDVGHCQQEQLVSIMVNEKKNSKHV